MTRLIALLLLLAGCAHQKSAPPDSAFGGAVLYRAPAGFKAEGGGSALSRPGAVVLSSDPNTTITLELRDGDQASDERMAALKERAMDGAGPVPAWESGSARVAGGARPIWRRVTRGQAFEPGAAAPTSTEEFCAVPMGGKFLLLSFSAMDYGAPKSPEARLAPWRAFLKTVEVPGAAPAQAAAAPKDAVFYYSGPATFTSGDGKPYGSTTSLVKREVLPSRGLIVETVVQLAREPGAPAREIVTTLTRRADTLVFDAADAAGTFSGTLTFDGPDWAWTRWSYAIALKDGGHVTGDGRLGDDGIRTDKRVLDAKGVVTVRVAEALAPIGAAEYEKRRRAMLGR